MQILGIVRLSPGQVGYFDDITRIHLTIATPEKPVFVGMNTTNLKNAVKSGRIKLVSGSLDPETIKQPEPVQVVIPEVPKIEKIIVNVEPPVETVLPQEGVNPVQVEADVQEPVEEVAVVEEVVDETEESTEEAIEVADDTTEPADAEKKPVSKRGRKSSK